MLWLQSPDTNAQQESGLLAEPEDQQRVGSNGDTLACLIASLAATSSSPSNGSDATNSTASAWSPSHNQVRPISSYHLLGYYTPTGASDPYTHYTHSSLVY